MSAGDRERSGAGLGAVVTDDRTSFGADGCHAFDVLAAALLAGLSAPFAPPWQVSRPIHRPERRGPVPAHRSL
jgi:hypothetical protein